MMRKKKGGILVTYTESMIECLESNLMLLKEELACLDHYPELTGTVRLYAAAGQTVPRVRRDFAMDQTSIIDIMRTGR